jgi:hypothetical protein
LKVQISIAQHIIVTWGMREKTSLSGEEFCPVFHEAGGDLVGQRLEGGIGREEKEDHVKLFV